MIDHSDFAAAPQAPASQQQQSSQQQSSQGALHCWVQASLQGLQQGLPAPLEATAVPRPARPVVKRTMVSKRFM